MRRTDREITDFAALVRVMERCDVCRLAFADGDYPYIVPLSFGLELQGEQVTLYFHSAREGKKLDLIRKNGRASFEMDCGHELMLCEQAERCTMNYESVIGRGRVMIVSDEGKKHGLDVLMHHYRPEGDFRYGTTAIPKTTVFKLVVEEMTGKKRT